MNRIRDLRLKKGMKQADLADLLNTRPQTVSHYEREDRGLDVATICRLCEIFSCSADYLLGRSELPSAGLSADEEALLLAWRAADARSREIVQLTLAPWKKDAISQEAI